VLPEGGLDEEKAMKYRIGIALMAIMLASVAHAERKGPTGHAGKGLGPNSGGQVAADRSISGNNAESSFSAGGKRGKSVTGSASSTVGAGKASGTASVQTSGGRGASAEGSGRLTPSGATGSGSVTTNSGKTVNATGSASKNDSGVSASGTATTGSGKAASASLEGDKEGGTVTVTTDQGTRSTGYGSQGKRAP